MIRRWGAPLLYLTFCVGLLAAPAFILAQLTGGPLGTAGSGAGATGATGPSGPSGPAGATGATGTGLTTAPADVACPTGSVLFLPGGTLNLPQVASNSNAATSVGQNRCQRWTQPCTQTYTKMGLSYGFGLAASQAAWAIYSADGNTKIVDSGIKSTASSGTQSITGQTIALVGGTAYWSCWSGSVNATLAYNSYSNGSGPAAAGLTGFTAITGTAANLGQFPDACTATITPYACCTAADTGASCPGMPATLGVITAAQVVPPIIIME